MAYDWKELYAKKCAQFDMLMGEIEYKAALQSKLLSPSAFLRCASFASSSQPNNTP